MLVNAIRQGSIQKEPPISGRSTTIETAMSTQLCLFLPGVVYAHQASVWRPLLSRELLPKPPEPELFPDGFASAADHLPPRAVGMPF
jgi:hypothetical protein